MDLAGQRWDQCHAIANARVIRAIAAFAAGSTSSSVHGLCRRKSGRVYYATFQSWVIIVLWGSRHLPHGLCGRVYAPCGRTQRACRTPTSGAAPAGETRVVREVGGGHGLGKNWQKLTLRVIGSTRVLETTVGALGDRIPHVRER